MGGPEPRLLAHEFLPLPGHAVFLDLSQPWDRSGTVVGGTGFRTAGVRLFGCS